MGLFRASVRREIRRFGHTPVLVVSAIVIPVVMTLLYVAMFWRGTVHDLPVAVWDGDHSALSRQIVRMVDATPSVEVVLQVEGIDQGRRAMVRGEVDALIVIPPGLQAEVMGAGAEDRWRPRSAARGF